MFVLYKCKTEYFAHLNTCGSIHLLSKNCGEYSSSIAKMQPSTVNNSNEAMKRVQLKLLQ